MASDDAPAHAEKNAEGRLKNRLWGGKRRYFLTGDLNEWAEFQLVFIHMVL